MGVYSLEAAELLAAKNKPAINESFTPYENPILEYGIKSIRADFALFEAQLELDFKEYYDSLNEADNNKDNSGTTVNVQNGQADPEFDAKKRAADNAQDKKEKEDADAQKAQEDASKKSKFNQTVGKLKIDSGTIRKFGELLKRLWQNLVTSLKSMLNRLIGSFNNFADKNGEKFNAAVAKISNADFAAKYDGEEISIMDPQAVESEFKSLISSYTSAFANLDSMSIEDVNGKVSEFDDKINEIKNKAHGIKKSPAEAAKIVASNKGLLGSFKSTANAEFSSLVKFGESKETAANNAYSQAVRDQGQEAADKDSKLQVNKEKAQKVAQLGARLGAEYGKAMSSATGSIMRTAFGIVANVEGKTVKAKVNATKEAIKNRGDNGETGEEDYDATSESAFEDDDLFTVNETAAILQVMVEDTCDINFDECFDF